MKPRSSPDRLVLRSPSGVALFAAVSALTLYLLLDALARGAVGLALHALPFLAVVDWTVYLVMVRPCVVLTTEGIEVVNVFVRHRVPWYLVDEVRSRFQVRIEVTGGRVIRSWGAPSSGGGRTVDLGAQEVSRSGRRSTALRGDPIHRVIENWRSRHGPPDRPTGIRSKTITGTDTAALVVTCLLLTLSVWEGVFR